MSLLVQEVERPIKLSSQFLSEIECSNQNKSSDAPCALIAYAGSERSIMPVINTKAMEYNVLTLGKVYRITIRIMDSKDAMRLAIEQTRDLTHRAIELLVIYAHGSNHSMNFGSNFIYSTSNVSSQDFAALHQKAVIFLASCDTGQSVNSFAAVLSRITQKCVFAPQKEIDSFNMRFSVCSKHHEWEMVNFTDDDPKRQHVVKFQPDQTSRICECWQANDPSWQSELRSYLLKIVDSDADAFYELGLLSEIKNDPAEAMVFYKQGAAKEHVGSQFRLATYYSSEQKFEDAKIWFRKAALQNFRGAQFQLGLLHLYLEEEDDAEYWLKLAAEQDHDRAQYYLGRFYHAKGKLIEASRWYRAAAVQGNDKARLALRSLRKKSNWQKIISFSILAGSAVAIMVALSCLESKQTHVKQRFRRKWNRDLNRPFPLHSSKLFHLKRKFP